MLALDLLDKLSDKRWMSIKNAPPKWNEISQSAKACGAGDWAMRKWLERCEVPPAWKLKILSHASGRLSLDDLVITKAEVREAAE